MKKSKYLLPNARRKELTTLKADGLITVKQYGMAGHYLVNGYLQYWPKSGKTWNMGTGERRTVRRGLSEVISGLPGPPKIEEPPLSRYERALASPHWAHLKSNAIKESDGHCTGCSQRRNKLHLHHLTYERLGHELPEDVTLLCQGCHRMVHDKDIEKKLIRKIRRLVDQLGSHRAFVAKVNGLDKKRKKTGKELAQEKVIAGMLSRVNLLEEPTTGNSAPASPC